MVGLVGALGCNIRKGVLEVGGSSSRFVGVVWY